MNAEAAIQRLENERKKREREREEGEVINEADLVHASLARRKRSFVISQNIYAG